MSFCCAFTIKSDTRYLAVLRQWLRAAGKSGNFRMTKSCEIACNMALVEAVNNAIFHAHKRRQKMPVKIFLKLDSDQVTIEVIDRGMGLGRHAKIRPDSMTTHGRGLFLIHSLMNSVESRMRNGTHVLKMRYNLCP